MIVPSDLALQYERMSDLNDATDDISDWLSDETGFCHYGFDLIHDVTNESVCEDLYRFFSDEMARNEASDMQQVRSLKGKGEKGGIVIDCKNRKRIILRIQVEEDAKKNDPEDVTALIDTLNRYVDAYRTPPYGREVDGTCELLTRAASSLAEMKNKLGNI